MELKTFDRLILLNILPKEGDVISLRVIRKLRDDLGFTEAEIKALEFHQDENGIRWKTEADQPKEIEIGDKAREIIRDRLAELNKQKKLTEEHIPLYERFVEAYENGR